MPNPYTGTLNDPISEAQHGYTGKDWERYLAILNKQLGGALPRMGTAGPGAPVSLGGAGRTDRGRGSVALPSEGQRIGDEDVFRTNQINAYLGQLTDENRARAQEDRDLAAHNQAVDAQSAGRQAAERGLAIANDPRTSAQGRPILTDGQHGYMTGAPDAAPVNRQAVASQMAPGQIAPPAAPAPITFRAPEPVLVGGKRQLAQQGSDGRLYDMARRPIDPATVQDKDAPAHPVAPVDAAGAPLAGDALLSTLPTSKQKLITAVLEGRQSIPSGAALKDPYWKDVLETANAIDPNFDTVNFNARANTRKDFTSGKGATQINAINTVVGHLHDLAETGTKLDNTGHDWLNAIRNKLTPGGSERGVAINNFETLKEGVATELMRTWRQVGAGSEKEIEDWKAQIGAAKSPQELQGAFKTIGGMLESKLSALDSQYKQGMGSDKISAITPESRKRLDALQGIKEAPAAAGGKIRAVDPQGNVHEAAAGTALPAGWKLEGG